MPVYQFYKEQKIPATKELVWDFISSPNNLKKITPDYMGFNIISQNLAKQMYPGMMISYQVSPILGIKMLWVTEITHVKDLDYFVDEQRVGPYSIWHHEHQLKEIDGGVLMTDLITYQPPMGFLGAIANQLFIKKQLHQIFDYRRQAVIDIFGEFKPSK